MRIRRRWHSGLFAVLVVLLVGAAPAPAQQATAADPLPASLRQWVDEHGPLRVGYARSAAPVVVVDDGEATGGWAHDLYELMAIKLGIEVEHVLLPSVADYAAALSEGRIDLVAAAGSRPDLLAVAARGQRPLAWTPIVFVGHEDQQARGIDDLTGRVVTTIPGSPMEALLLERFPDATYAPVEDLPSGVRALVDDEVDLFLGPLAVIGSVLRDLDAADVGPVGDPVDVTEVASWALVGSPALAVHDVGRSLVTDTELAVVHVRWTGFDLGDPTEHRPAWLGPALLGLAALLGTLLAFNLALRRRVRHATASLVELNDDLEERVERRTRELKRANIRLSKANEALSEFARTVAHDLRGPITAMGGLASFARKTNPDQARRVQILASIERSSARLGDLVDGLLRDAIEAGGGAPTTIGKDFRGWLLEVLGPEAVQAGAHIEVDLPDGELGIDNTVLRRAALNLVGNAIKYATDGEGAHIRVSLFRTGDHWALVVDDDGAGIPFEDREQVFAAGYRGVGSDDDRGHGVGLGAVRTQVRLVGGDIEIGPSPLGGARFTVRLPIDPITDGTPTGKPGRRPSGDRNPAGRRAPTVVATDPRHRGTERDAARPERDLAGGGRDALLQPHPRRAT